MSRLKTCQILSNFVYIWQSYYRNKTVPLFYGSQCTCSAKQQPHKKTPQTNWRKNVGQYCRAAFLPACHCGVIHGYSDDIHIWVRDQHFQG